ncbi:MAG: hypothetical protein ACKOAD_00330 [Gammaproteobacteria bacterium]
MLITALMIAIMSSLGMGLYYLLFNFNHPKGLQLSLRYRLFFSFTLLCFFVFAALR